MKTWEHKQLALAQNPKRWLITGVAGFIGSHILEKLLQLNQEVIGIDNFATGFKRNLAEVRKKVTLNQWERFQFIDADIENHRTMIECFKLKPDLVLHQAALGSVPRSLIEPLITHSVNTSGFLNILDLARQNAVQRFVYASSSAVYGDCTRQPAIESEIGTALSPYAVSKHINELYAKLYTQCYGLDTVGLRYFNVVGPRQDPDGAYAAVIPKWIDSLLKEREVFINGDGSTSRDFCPVRNIVQANILAAITPTNTHNGRVFNVALGQQTSLIDLYKKLAQLVNSTRQPTFRAFRQGDIQYSCANTELIRAQLHFTPEQTLADSLVETVAWYKSQAHTVI